MAYSENMGLVRLFIGMKSEETLPQRIQESIVIPSHFTHTWSINFMSDALENGRKSCSFKVIDDYNREVLFIETD